MCCRDKPLGRYQLGVPQGPTGYSWLRAVFLLRPTLHFWLRLAVILPLYSRVTRTNRMTGTALEGINYFVLPYVI